MQLDADASMCAPRGAVAIARRPLAAGFVFAGLSARCMNNAKRGAAGVWGSQEPERAAADRFDRSEALKLWGG